MNNKKIGQWTIAISTSKRFGVCVDIYSKDNLPVISYTLKTFLTYGGNELKLNASNPSMTMNAKDLYQAQAWACENQPQNISTYVNGGVAWY
jgi:hypothetical protein